MMAALGSRLIINGTKNRLTGVKWKKLTSLSASVKHSLSSAASESLTVVENVGGIAYITLNNPKKRNALSLAMLDSLHSALTSMACNQNLRVIVLRANGPVFSAGHDLKELTSTEGSEAHTKVFDKCSDVMKLVQDIDVPVMAEVRGLATAAGCQLVASCDIAVASEQSRFATPGVSVGLFCSTPAVAVGRAVPRKVAMEMLFTGHPITAQEALQHGLVSRVVPEEQLTEKVKEIAERICDTSKPVSVLGKKCFYKQMSLNRDDAYKLAGATMVRNLQLEDGKEGIDAFIQKRKPAWTHQTDK